MQDLLQVAQRVRVGENDRAQLSAVDRAVGQQDIASESLDDAPVFRRTRLEQLVGDAVGVDHLGTQLRAGCAATWLLPQAMLPVNPMM